MTLAAGSRLGPYEILGPLGAGGMGEVYKARDKKPLRAARLDCCILNDHTNAYENDADP